MARVIKAGAGQPRPATRLVLDHGKKKLIGKELYQAKQDAEHILMRAEESRAQRLAEGKKQAAQAREESMARGASEAFAAAASEALAAFRRRAERYAEASEDIRALALEVCKKVLGNPADLGPKDVDVILSRGMAQLRARRKLRLQVSERRLKELAAERPNLMKALVSEPDLLIEAVDDVGEGFARVVTEIGGALCAEDSALDELAAAVNVKEIPRKGARAAAPNTQVGARPSSRSLEEVRNAPLSDLPEARVEEEAGGDSTFDLRKQRRPVRNDPISKTDGDPDLPSADDIEEIVAQEDESRTVPRKAVRPADVRPPPTARDDEDLELFTDDAVPPKKRR